jgi:hypothetical protein
MLAPQYSLRKLLALVTLAGFAYLVLAVAVQQNLWAVALLITMFGLGVTILLQAILFGIAQLVGAQLRRRQRRRMNAGAERGVTA